MDINTLALTAQLILQSPWWKILLGLFALVAGVAGLMRLINQFKEFFLFKKIQKLNKGLERATHIASFTNQEIADAIKNYIEPDCSQTDPSNESDLRQVAAVRGKVFKTVEEFIEKGRSNRHLLILADSGMGKTTFCLNYYAREQKKKVSKRKLVAVVPLGRADAIQQIKSIEQKRDTVLFLDALDEDTAAIKDSDSQLQMLMDAAADFYAVVVTCRSQFFLNDGSIPKDTGIAYVGPRKGGQAGTFRFYKLYLLPFTESQIKQYIRIQFPWHKRAKRTKAHEMVNDIPELSVRPMLLTLIPDLLKENKKVSEIYDLYSFMVSSWLERESKWIAPKTLFEFSKILAVEIFVNRTKRQHERISLTELKEIAKDISGDIEGPHLTSRSLLNRDSDGNFKFAHRSIMEYFFIMAFIEGDESCKEVEWTDVMRMLFISWGRSQQGIDNVIRVKQILSMDLRKTKLLPLSTDIRGPQILTSIEKLKPENFKKISGQLAVPLPWREGSIRYSLSGELMQIFDLAYDLRWKIILTTEMESLEEIKLYRRTLPSIGQYFEDFRSPVSSNLFSDERLPSINELISVWEAEKTLLNKQIFDRREFYWVGDRIGKSRYLACSVGLEPIDHELLKPISIVARHPELEKEHLFVYEIIPRTVTPNSPHFSAQAMLVESGGIEYLWYNQPPGATNPKEYVCTDNLRH